MHKEHTKEYYLTNALAHLSSVHTILSNIDGLKTVKENLKYIIEDLQEELEYTKEVENGVFVKFHDPKLVNVE